MSAQSVEKLPVVVGGESADDERGQQDLSAPLQVEVRRNAVVSAVLGAAASAIAIAYLWRAAETGHVVDWALCGILGLVGAVFLHSLLDARTPLLVADEMGVRIRLGTTWRGLPWEAIERVVVRPRRGLLHDGSLVMQLTNVARTIEGLEGRARRHAALNRKVYGGALAVPLGVATRTDTPDQELSDRIAGLSRGRAEVVTLIAPPKSGDDDASQSEAATTDAAGDSAAPTDAEPTPEALSDVPDLAPAVEADPSGPADQGHENDADSDARRENEPRGWRARRRRRRALGHSAGEAGTEAGMGFDVVDLPTEHDRTDEAQDESQGVAQHEDVEGAQQEVQEGAEHGAREGAQQEDRHEPSPGVATVAPLRGDELRGGVTIRIDDDSVPRSTRTWGAVDSMREAVNPVGRKGSRVRAIAKLGDPVAPLVIDDYQPEPAYDPVIGPELAASRTRVGLSVDELAERTRIRPHVIESIEVDDFTPCGGDFYARGHIRTLARVLGKDPVPLLEFYEVRYAHAPVNARKVFEAELATGMGGHMTRPYGGPNWTGLVAVVLLLVLVWAGVRLFSGEGGELQEPPPVLDGSAGLSSYTGDPGAPAGTAPVTVVVSAVNGDAEIEVRDGDGSLVHEGQLADGDVKRLRAVPPVTVTSDDGGAVGIRVADQDEELLGEEGAPATRTFTSTSPD